MDHFHRLRLLILALASSLLLGLASCTTARDQLAATKDGIDGMGRAFTAQSSILHKLVDDPDNGMTPTVRAAYQGAIKANEDAHAQFSQLVLTVVGTYAGIAEWISKTTGGGH